MNGYAVHIDDGVKNLCKKRECSGRKESRYSPGGAPGSSHFKR